MLFFAEKNQDSQVPGESKAVFQWVGGLHVVFLKLCYLLITWITSTKGLQRCLTSAWVHFTTSIHGRPDYHTAHWRSIKNNVQFHIGISHFRMAHCQPTWNSASCHYKVSKSDLKVQSLITKLNITSRKRAILMIAPRSYFTTRSFPLWSRTPITLPITWKLYSYCGLQISPLTLQRRSE